MEEDDEVAVTQAENVQINPKEVLSDADNMQGKRK